MTQELKLKTYQQSLITDAAHEDEHVIPVCMQAIACGMSNEMIDAIVEHLFAYILESP